MPVSPADDVIGLYEAIAAGWSDLRGRQLFETPWLNRFVDELPVGSRHVLDLGCGSGEPLAGYLISKGCRITGVDGASAMIERASKTFPDQRWITADMRTLPPIGPFDGIMAWHSFFHLRPDDQRPMFAVFQRLAAPGAVLMFTSGTSEGEAIGQLQGRPLYHGSLDTAEYRELLCAHGFSVIRHVESDPDCGNATVWLARRETR